ncbi:MAG: OprO/OprP family phosphate-selective porin [Kordiimonadaceae bacterium]|nr:OprO/OprP family phosphate-selective porin [Kordiimonadaceae bacterium]
MRKASSMAIALIVASNGLVADDASEQELKRMLKQQAQQIEALTKRLSQLEASLPVLVNTARKTVVAIQPSSKDTGMLAQHTHTPMQAGAKKKSKFTVKPRGRVEVDTVVYDEEDGGRQYREGSQFRRARLGVQGKLAGGFEYQIEADFAGGDKAKLDDTYLRYRINPKTAVTFGYHKVYHSLAAATSDLNASFMERHMVSNIFEVGAGGRMGASVLTGGSNWSGQFGVFAGSPNSGDKGKDGWGINGRLTWAPYLKEDRLIHVGIAAYHRDEDDDLISMGDRPEIRRDSFKPFASGEFQADTYNYVNAEFAGVAGPLSAQFEYGRMSTSATVGDRQFEGYSAQVGYFLTGESLPYSAHKGAFGKLKPHKALGAGGWGAFELAARYSYVDLRDAASGSFGRNITLGVNWYPTASVRFMLNAVDFEAEGDTQESGRAYGVRTQVRW